MEVGDGHLAREDEGDGTGEEADEQQAASHDLESPAMPASEAIGTVPPPGISGPGKANSFPDPNWKKRNAETIRRMLRSWGAQERHRVAMFSSGMEPPRASGDRPARVGV
jgi:hypothetical protein